MNYLAHLFLSANRNDLMVGNYLGDFVKGSEMNNFSKEIQDGIKLHRKIDRFTDDHDEFKRSVERLRPKYRKYAGVIVDVYYDFLLAKNWKRYSPGISLQAFANEVYVYLTAREGLLPSNGNRFLNYMKHYNILYRYGDLEGIERVLTGLSNRTKFESKMEQAHVDLVLDLELYGMEFSVFFPSLIAFVKEQEEYERWTKIN